MYTVKFTKTQAERYAKVGVPFLDADLFEAITADAGTMKNVSEMDYIFQNDKNTLLYGMRQYPGKAPFVGYVPEEEAIHLCAKFSCLIDKPELVSGHTIIEMKAARVRDMKLNRKHPEADSTDWGVFAKVQQVVKTLSGSLEIYEWILFDNTQEFNAGIPTVSEDDFADVATSNLWEALQTWEKVNTDTSSYKPLGANRYLGLRSIYLLYHNIAQKKFVVTDCVYTEIIITYSTKSPWEPYDKWDCLTWDIVCNLYVDVTHDWSDDQYDLSHTARTTLYDYFKDPESVHCDEIKKQLIWIPAINHE